MKSSIIRSRWAAIGAAVAVSLGAGGIGISQATTSSGEMPIYIPIEPCRLADTRPAFNVGPRSTPLGAAETYTLSGRGTVGDCTLPTGSTGLSLNVTAVGATLPTFLTLFPADSTLPIASHLNPVPGQPPTPNAVNVDLDTSGEFSVYNLQGTVNVIIDVVGYYDHHTHDNRYYTKAQTRNVATPEVTTFTYLGRSTRPFGTTSPAIKLRDLGSFTSSGGTVKITWSSVIGGSGAACNFGIRVDGVGSLPADDVTGLVGTEAVINGAVDGVPAMTVDVFHGLAAGDHTVELWYRSVQSSCEENGGIYPRSVLIEEYPD